MLYTHPYKIGCIYKIGYLKTHYFARKKFTLCPLSERLFLKISIVLYYFVLRAVTVVKKQV